MERMRREEKRHKTFQQRMCEEGFQIEEIQNEKDKLKV